MPDPTPATATPAAAATPGGLKAWLPLIATVVAMPLLAYGTITFLILPKLQPAGAHPATATEGHEDAPPPTEGHEAAAAPGGSPGRKGKVNVTLDKLVVNVAGTMGTRYLMASITLVGTDSRFKATIEDHHDQLMDLANSTLSSKTIADLEKPGARNLIKTELISIINNALGESLVKEIYLPEMAIQ